MKPSFLSCVFGGVLAAVLSGFLTWGLGLIFRMAFDADLVMFNLFPQLMLASLFNAAGIVAFFIYTRALRAPEVAYVATTLAVAVALSILVTMKQPYVEEPIFTFVAYLAHAIVAIVSAAVMIGFQRLHAQSAAPAATLAVPSESSSPVSA
jgi:hypothetical protein